MSSETQEKLAKIREAKAARAEAAAEAAALREIEMYELVEKFEGELGKRGAAFEIVETVDGPVVVKLGEVLVHQKFNAIVGEPTEAQLSAYVRPSVVHPPMAQFLEICAKRGGVLYRCGTTLRDLHMGRVKEEQGK